MAKKTIHEKLKNGHHTTQGPWRIYLMIAFVGLMIIGILGYAFFKGDKMIRVYAPLVDAAMEIRLEATTAHLWFEEIISGDSTEDISEVWEHQERAQWYAKAMLEGGKNPEGTYLPIQDAEMREEIQIVLQRLAEFRKISEERLASQKRSGIGTEIDQRYDRLFQTFLKEADNVETQLQKVMAKDLTRFRYTQLSLIIIAILLFCIVELSFRHFNNQRMKSLSLLEETNRALQKSEENLSITLHSIGDAVISTDIEGNVVRMNPIAEELTGWNCSEAKGHHITEVFYIINEKTREIVTSPVERVIREGIVVGLANHTVLISKNGDEYFIADSGAPIRNENNEIVGVVLVFRDFTEKYMAEMAIQKSEERYREFVEGTDDLVTTIGPDGNLFFTNRVSEKIFGLPPEECVGLSAFDFVHPEDREQTQKWFEDMIETKQTRGNIENRQISRNGEVHYMHWASNFHYDNKGAFVGMDGIARDVTQRKIVEEQVKKNLKEKEILLRELYHRTKNNMQVIFSMLRLRARHLNDKNVTDVFKEVENKILSMALVHQKLYESKDLSYLNLKEYIKEVVSLVEKSYRSSFKRIKMTVQGEDANVLLDTAMPCGLIINELVTNAIKYAFPDNRQGNIDITLNSNSDGELILKISDNGIGMPSNFDIRKNNSLGIQTVVDLVEYQLDGSVNFDYQNGVCCTIVLKNELYKPRI